MNSDLHLTDHDIAIVARLCRRLDGLPLAIEMVASWASVLGLEALEANLDGSLKAVLRARRTAPMRHSTLRAALEWSHELLSAQERITLRRLAVFAGTFSIAAAQSVAGMEDGIAGGVLGLIAGLIRKSMIAIVPGARENQYRLLETTRAFLLEKLAASDDLRTVRRRHADYVLHTLRQAMIDWETASDRDFLARYAPILDDLRNALEWSAQEEAELTIAIAGSSWPLWRELPVRAEGRRRLSAAMSQLSAGTPPDLEAHLRRGMGELYFNTAAVKDARREFERAVVLFRSQNDTCNLGSAIAAYGYASLMLGNIDEARISIDEALHLVDRARRGRSALAAAWSVKFCVEARLKSAMVLTTGAKAVRLCEVVGADRAALVVSANLVETVLETGDLDGAISSGRELAARLRDTYHTDILGYVLGMVSSGLTFRADLLRRLWKRRKRPCRCCATKGMLFSVLSIIWHFVWRSRAASKDAVLLSGYADSLFGEFGRPREPVGQEAVDRLTEFLKGLLPEHEIGQLRRMGEQLTEDQIVSLALSD